MAAVHFGPNQNLSADLPSVDITRGIALATHILVHRLPSVEDQVFFAQNDEAGEFWAVFVNGVGDWRLRTRFGEVFVPADDGAKYFERPVMLFVALWATGRRIHYELEIENETLVSGSRRFVGQSRMTRFTMGGKNADFEVQEHLQLVGRISREERTNIAAYFAAKRGPAVV